MLVRARDAMPRAFKDERRARHNTLQMGVRRLDLDAWLLVSEHYAAEIALKHRLLADGAEVMAAEPGTDAAIAETLALIEDHLRRHHPNLPQPNASHSPLARAGLLVQEDLCWLAPSPEGHRLVAAFVAFPARWRLAQKIGRPLTTIHAPVPGAVERLGPPMERLFERLEIDRPLWRANWSIGDDPALHQPVGAPARMQTGEMYLRVERQTLRRLPRTGMVLFTIHTFVEPLSEIRALPEDAAALAARLDDMSDAMLDYKGLGAIRAGLIARLRDGVATA